MKTYVSVCVCVCMYVCIYTHIHTHTHTYIYIYIYIYIYMISRWILHITRNVSDEGYSEKHKAHFLFNNFFSENLAVFKIMLRNILEPDKPQTTIKYDACALHDGSQRQETQTQNSLYLLLFHRNNGCTNSPECYFYTYTSPLAQHKVLVAPTYSNLIWTMFCFSFNKLGSNIIVFFLLCPPFVP